GRDMRVFDRWADLVDWAHSRISGPIRSTSEAEMPHQRAPEAIRERVLAALDVARPKHAPGSTKSRVSSCFHWWRHTTAGFGVGAARAAAVGFLVLSPAGQSPPKQVAAGHVRALQPRHLEDVVSTAQHTVKPWFDGRIDFAPPVKDLGPAGLKGGRIDFIGGR